MGSKESLQIAQLAGEEQWLSQRQIAQLLGVKTAIVADLIRYLYKTGELDQRQHTRKQQVMQAEGTRQVSREVNCYSRAVVLAVAWRVHSPRGEQFRQWASGLLEQQLSQGYTLNVTQLAESPALLASLAGTVAQLQTEQPDETQSPAAEPSSASDNSELMPLLSTFRRSLLKLYEFEYNRVGLRNTSMLAARPLEYFEVSRALSWLRETLFDSGEEGDFGIEKDCQLEALLILATGADRSPQGYASIEQKAVYLLWLVLHRQPFEAGNLQLAAFLFVWFLQRNGLLYRDDGSLRIQDNTLVSMVLLAARSPEQECDQLVSLLAGLINREN